ncbi:Proteasome subunit beta type-2 [Aphelenchoides fujianensis]|nr:Proteasome subunit beta type-2 [Aphelenchoides fujianensis]
MSGVNFLVGYRTEKFVLLVSDKVSFKYGALKVSDDASKEYQLGSHTYMSVIGESGDADNFGDWAKRNIYLYKLRHNYELSPRSAHHWLRKSIADNLRSEDFWRVDLLLGGYDTIEKRAYLGSVDYLGNGIHDQNYLMRGFGGRFGYAIMDSLYEKDASPEKALEIVKATVVELNRRFIASLPKYSVLLIDESGAQHLPDLVIE